MVTSWVTEISPWIQGLFGGTGATLFWEGILKPVRARRSLAHVLAEEVGHNLQYAAGQRLLVDKNPGGIPSDFSLSTQVYEALLPRIGELPKLVGEIVLLYRSIEALNAIPESFTVAFNKFHDPEGQPTYVLAQLKEQLNGYLGVYRTGLESVVNRANTLLPKLRRASVPWYRLDLRLRKPKLLSLDELGRTVEQLANDRAAQRKGIQP